MAHLANSFGWTEDYMMNMSLSRLLLYYTASLDLPYIIELEEIEEYNGVSETSETNMGNKKIKREKKGLWDITTTTIYN